MDGRCGDGDGGRHRGCCRGTPRLVGRGSDHCCQEVIAERSKDGVFAFRDVRSGDQLSLVLDDVRVVRGLPVFGWFPNVVFHDQDVPAKKYALDFWLKPDGDRLKLMDIRIHKAPQPDGSSWMSITRAPLPWWWLPTIERVSAVVGLQAWQVMGAIHTHIADATKDEAVDLADASGKPTVAAARRSSAAGGKVKDRRQVLCLCRISQVRKRGRLLFRSPIGSIRRRN